MATVPPPSPDTSNSDYISRSTLYETRTGRRPKFTPEDDLMLVREVAAAKAHLAPNGATKERYETAANKANATRRLTCPVTWKSVQDRYKRIQARFDERERVESLMSGVGGELGEIEELLSSMKEARQDLLNCKSASRRAAQEREAEKERLGSIVREKAMNRAWPSRSGSEEDFEGIEGETLDSDHTPKKRLGKRKLNDTMVDPFQDDIAAFTAALQKGEEARLALEERRMASAVEEREKDRKERREEREAASKLELQKFKLMMDAFKSR